NRRAPRGHWSTIPYLDAGRVGDHKVIWELNRQQWLVTLAQASALSGRREYLDRAATYLTGWLAENPPRRGINWASSLEVALRGIAWTWFLHLARDADGIDAEATSRLLESLETHGRHVERFLSRWFSPNTHLTGEALGLLYLGSAWPDFPRAGRWTDTGWSILLEQLPIHLREDGTYFEQATWYLAYTMDFYLHALALGASSGRSLPPGHRARLVAGARALRQLMNRDGTLPLIGDDDGGRLLPLGSPVRTDFSDTLALASVLLELPELAPGGQTPAGMVWLLGTDRVRSSWEAGAGRYPGTDRSTALPAGGWYFLRASEEDCMLLDAGPHGELSAGHAHADALALVLTCGGQPVIVDAGTFSYVGEEREQFRRTAAHNTMTVGNESSARPGGPFRWLDRPSTDVTRWVATDPWDFFEASHDGFETRFGGNRHTRRVLRFGKGWMVIDQLSGGPPVPQGELRFHFAPGLALDRSAEGAWQARRPGGGTPVSLITDTAGACEETPAWVSRCYGAREPARAFLRRIPGEELALGVATVLESGVGRAVLERTRVAGGVAWAWSGSGGTVRALLRAPGSAAVHAGDLVSTARFCIVLPAADGTPRGAILSGPGEALEGGTPLMLLESIHPAGAA
ncbi:MAG TPA: alginate lyase family protein, partial [Gemmatimonadales bacterium]